MAGLVALFGSSSGGFVRFDERVTYWSGHAPQFLAGVFASLAGPIVVDIAFACRVVIGHDWVSFEFGFRNVNVRS